MESQKRQPAAPIVQEIEERAREFNFFQAVYLISKAQADSAPVGDKGPVRLEPVRFRANASLGFPSSDIDSLTQVPPRGDSQLPPLLCTVNFLGLYGPASPLPTFYTEDVLGRTDDENTSRHFMDIFHHRLVSFVYRSWTKYHYHAQFTPGKIDPFSEQLLALVGMYSGGKAILGDLEWRKLIPLIGLLGMRARSAATVAHIVSYYFDGVPAQVEEFVARRVAIDAGQHARLGVSQCVLGQEAFLGSSVPDIGTKFCLHLGPVDFAAYKNLLPGRRGYTELRALMQVALVDRLDYDISIKVDVRDVPVLNLDKKSAGALGWTSWLGKPKDSFCSVSQLGESAAA